MATHRHRSAVFVLATATALLVGGSAPVQAATSAGTRDSSGISARTLQVSQQRLAARRTEATTAHRRALARIAAVRAARKATAKPSPTVSPTASATALPTVSPTVAPTLAPTTAPTVTPTSIATTSPSTAPAGSPSGVAAPRGNLAGWTQTYVEDFTTNVATGAWPGAYTNHWYAYDDGSHDTSRNGTYMPSKVLSVHDGVLDYSVRTENGQHLVAAPVMKDTYGQIYGRYSVRFRSDRLPGYKNAWLLWPDTERWPDDGEIDFPEGNLDGTIGAFSHYASATGGQDQFSTSSTFSEWHTATIEWLPGKVTFTLDDRVLGSSTRDVPNTAMHWVLQTETALEGGAPTAGVAGHVLVDWVALYKRA